MYGLPETMKQINAGFLVVLFLTECILSTSEKSNGGNIARLRRLTLSIIMNVSIRGNYTVYKPTLNTFNAFSELAKFGT